MKIVKSFEDMEFFRKRYRGNYTQPDDLWEWGLGDDGELYCRCSVFEDGLIWHQSHFPTGLVLSLRDMKRIVKEFGHLVVFT